MCKKFMVVFVLVLLGACGAPSEPQQAEHADEAAAAAAEIAACRSALPEDEPVPVWRLCGSSHCFYCADARGELHAVRTPPPACGPKETVFLYPCDR